MMKRTARHQALSYFLLCRSQVGYSKVQALWASQEQAGMASMGIPYEIAPGVTTLKVSGDS